MFRVGQDVTIAMFRGADGQIRPILGVVSEVPDERRVLVRAAYPLDDEGRRLIWMEAEQLARIQREHPVLP